MGNILSHKATWFLLGAAAMYFLYPQFRGVVGSLRGGQQG